MPYSPEHGDPKSAPSTHGRHGRLAHAGVVCAKNALGRTQPSATPLRDYPRPCNHPPDWTFCSFSAACLLGLEVSWRHLNVAHVCSSTKPSARPGAHIQRHQIEPAGAIRLSSTSYAAHQNGNGLPAADRFCRWHAHCRFGDLKAWPNARAADGSSRKTSGRSQRSRGAHGPHHAPIC